MAWELSSDLQKQVKDDNEYSEDELFGSEKSDSDNETEDVENVEGMDGPDRQRNVEDDERVL